MTASSAAPRRAITEYLADEVFLMTFRDFLEEIQASEALYFWADCEVFRRIEDTRFQSERATQMWNKYFTRGSIYEVNVDYDVKNRLQRKIEKGAIDAELFVEAERFVLQILDQDSFYRFHKTDAGKKYFADLDRRIKEIHRNRGPGAAAMNRVLIGLKNRATPPKNEAHAADPAPPKAQPKDIISPRP